MEIYWNKAGELLTRLEALNIGVDHHAKAFLPMAQSLSRHFTILLEPWSIWFEGKKVSTNLHNTISDTIHSKEAKDFWAKKRLLDTDTTNLVD